MLQVLNTLTADHTVQVTEFLIHLFHLWALVVCNVTEPLSV
jgi:hypothetical protein